MNFANYELGEFYDEMLTDPKGARPCARHLMESIQSLPPGEFARRQAAAERALMQMGITFNVYGEQAGVEKIFPFDIVPRIVPAAEWRVLEKGLKQRIHALNLFIHDIYHDQKILKAGVVPREIYEVQRRQGLKYVLAAIGSGGGVGVAVLFEVVHESTA